MTIYFVGLGGNDNNSGKSWDTRLATLNGAENKPVVPGDEVRIAPGVYREMLTVDVSGTAAKPITYIGDVTGELTGCGFGGPVRITGSDNDQTTVRAYCINASAKDYRTFRGFHFDTTSSRHINISNCDYWIIEDFCGQWGPSIYIASTSTHITIRRSFLLIRSAAQAIELTNGAPVDDTGHLIENCIFSGRGNGIRDGRHGGMIVRNCQFLGVDQAIRITAALTVGQTLTANNCIFVGNSTACWATAVAEFIEDYNTFWVNSTDRNTVNVGANSLTYPPLLEQPLFHAGADQISGYRLPWWFGSLSQWSQLRQITGAGEPSEDLFGVRRPYTHGGPISSLCSWGAVQWFDIERSVVQAYDGTQSVIARNNAAAWMFVPGISAVQHTISARAYRSAGYVGPRAPAMIIKQPGQDDRVTVDAGAAGAWNLLSDTFTPAADPPWLLVELRNFCHFTSTATGTSLTSSATGTSTATATATISTLTTTTVTQICDVWFDALGVA